MGDIQDYLTQFVSKIDDKRKQEVYGAVKEGSTPSNDFFIMLSLASIIATLGLLTNSVAVIIGAMLVSPLLIAVMAISLGTIKGDFNLFWDGMRGMAKGVAVSLLIAIIITLLIPNQTATSEILARVHPTPLDLLIAVASGLAGAYAVCRKNISSALPGIAIAVAVLPPLNVVGIGIAMRRPDIAIGGALLFAANVIAIDLAACFIFWLMGFSPKLSLIKEKDTMTHIKTSVALLLLILIPLAWLMYESINTTNTNATIGSVLQAQIDGIDQATITEFSYAKAQNGVVTISATIDSPTQITADKAGEMRTALEKNLGAPVDLDLKVVGLNLVTANHTTS